MTAMVAGGVFKFRMPTHALVVLQNHLSEASNVVCIRCVHDYRTDQDWNLTLGRFPGASKNNYVGQVEILKVINVGASKNNYVGQVEISKVKNDFTLAQGAMNKIVGRY